MDGPTMIASGAICMPGLGLMRQTMEPQSVQRSVSPIGFEATMNVAMELENELKTESSQTGYSSTPKPRNHEVNGGSKLVVPKLELEGDGSEAGSPTRAMEELMEEEDDVESLDNSPMRSNGSFDGELSPGMPSVDNSKEGPEMLEDDADPFQKLNSALERNGLQMNGNGAHHGLNGSTRPDSSEGDYYEGSESSQHHLYRHQLHPRDGDPGGLDVGTEDSQQPLQCHLCPFITHSKFQLNAHLSSHYDHKCNHCDYTSRTEGRLKRHMKDFHAELPVDDFSPGSVIKGDATPQNKVKTYRCKQCSYVATEKTDFWAHSKNHIKAEKLLTCPKCPFVTEYKHHLEYHLRNHFGSKPFKCPKCSYSCVNKSMLNSHMKSHSNIYQYRCANCTYATKYCHSLKLHLRKYAHTPSTVLNADGTPNPVPVIDVYGTRRGPRTKKTHEEPYANAGSNGTGSLPFSPLQLPGNGALSPSAFFYQGVPNGFHPNSEGHLHPRNIAGSTGSAEDDESVDNRRHHSPSDSGPFKCNLCDFTADHRDTYSKHMLLHAASENQDLCNLYGINSDSLLQDPSQQQQHSQMEAVVAVATALGLNAQQQQAHRADLFRHHAFNILHMQNNQDHGQNFAFHKGSGPPPPKTQPEEPTRRTPPSNQLPNPLEHLRAFSEQVTAKPYMMREFSSNLFASPPALGPNNPVRNGAENPPRTSPVINGYGPKTPARHPPKGTKPAAMKGERPNHPSADNHSSFVPLDLSSTKGPRPPGPISFPYNTPQQQFPFAQQLQRYPAFLPQSQIGSQALEIVTNAASPLEGSQVEPSPSPNQTKNRRKGKAFKLDRICMKLHKERESPVGQMVLTDDSMEDGELSKNSDVGEDRTTEPAQSSPRDFTPGPNAKKATPNNDSGFDSNDKPKLSPLMEGADDDPKNEDVQNVQNDRGHNVVTLVDTIVGVKDKELWAEAYQCPYCDMAFKHLVMYTVHMGHHDFNNPFRCNMCGHQTEDKVSFFLHIARTAHK